MLDHLEVRLAISAIAAMIIGVWFFRPAPNQSAKVQAALIAEYQSRGHEAWKGIRAASGEAWEPAEAERVEREVLPPWREARRFVEAARSGPPADYFPAELEQFYRLHEESWVTLIEAVRTDDETLFARHAELFRQAEVVGAKVVAMQVAR